MTYPPAGSVERAELSRILVKVRQKLNPTSTQLRITQIRCGAVNAVYKLLLPGEAQPHALRIRRTFFPEQSDSRLAKDAVCAFLTARHHDSMVDVESLSSFLECSEGGSLPFRASAPIRFFQHAPGTSGPPAWSLSHWIEGEPLLACPSPAHYRALGRAVHGLHRTRFAAFHPELDRPERTISWSRWYGFMMRTFATDALGAATGGEVLARLRGLKLGSEPGRFVLTHGDVHPANVIVSAAGVKLIDWDEASVNTPETDMALIRHCTRVDHQGDPVADETLFQQVLQGYADEGGELDPRLLDLAELLFLMKRFTVPDLPQTGNLSRKGITTRICELADSVAA